MNNEKLTILTNSKNWLDSLAAQQANDIAKLRGIKNVFAMPDLHAGKVPVGIAAITEGIIYPHLIGNDIGCGMSIFGTGIETKRVKLEKWVSKLNTIKNLSTVPNGRFYDNCPISDFGTIGSGNHFAEFQAIDKVYDDKKLSWLNIDKNELLICIHSGSRSYGTQIINTFKSYEGYAFDSKEAKSYIEMHNDALMWASLNRDQIPYKLISYLGFQPNVDKKLECFHNFLETDGNLCYHRKGSVSSKNGPVFIAGSRGTLSYIVSPTGLCENYGCSLAHGSGRKWTRSMCKSRIKEKYEDIGSIRQNRYNGRLVCHDYDLLFEEAPEAYKNIETVIDVLKEYGLIEIIASVKPVLTFKG